MRFVIIGGEAAGMSAAAKIRRMKPEDEVVVYEKTEVLSFGACGLPYYVGDFFDDTDYMVSRTAEQLRESGIQVYTGHEVTGVDTEKKTVFFTNTVTGERGETAYDKLLIATGARAILPPISNLNLKNVHTLKNLEDGVTLKKMIQSESVRKVVVIGAGYIGIEVAEAMVHRGKEVRMIQLDSRVLAESFDSEITDVVEAELRKHSVELHVNETVKALEGTDQVTGVITDKGRYDADLVVVAVGVRPNTEFLAETSVEMLSNGAVRVDALGRSNVPDLYGAGDCATVYHRVKEGDVYIPLATTANKLGRLAGENMAGKDNSFPGTLGTAAVKFMELGAARTGITEADAQKAGWDYKTVFVRDKNHSNYLPGQTDIFTKLIYDRTTKKIIGGQIAGRDGSVLRINAIAACIWSGMTLDQLGMMDFFYAPPYSRPWDVVNIAANAAK